MSLGAYSMWSLTCYKHNTTTTRILSKGAGERKGATTGQVASHFYGFDLVNSGGCDGVGE